MIISFCEHHQPETAQRLCITLTYATDEDEYFIVHHVLEALRAHGEAGHELFSVATTRYQETTMHGVETPRDDAGNHPY